jgi:hypothetical protein
MRPGTIYSPSSVVVRRDALERVGGFDPQLSTAADLDLWIRLAALGDFGYLDEPLTRYRVHAGQMHRNIHLMARDCEYVLEKAWKNGLFENRSDFRYAQARMFLVVALEVFREISTAQQPASPGAPWWALVAGRPDAPRRQSCGQRWPARATEAGVSQAGQTP